MPISIFFKNVKTCYLIDIFKSHITICNSPINKSNVSQLNCPGEQSEREATAIPEQAHNESEVWYFRQQAGLHRTSTSISTNNHHETW